MLFAAEKSLVGENAIQLGNPDVRLNAVWARFGKNGAFQIESGTSATLPANAQSRERESLRYGLGLTSRASFRLPSYGVRLRGYYDVTITRLYHTYYDTTDSQINSKRQLAHLASITAPAGRWNLTCRGSFRKSWTYHEKLSSTFNFAEEISFELFPYVTLAVGHQTGGNWFVANGRDLNLSVFSDTSSRLYFSTSIVL